MAECGVMSTCLCSWLCLWLWLWLCSGSIPFPSIMLFPSAGSCRAPALSCLPNSRCLLTTPVFSPLSPKPFSSSSSSLQLHLHETPTTLFRRRESIGLALSLALLHALVPPSQAAEASPAPCEFTVAPSGLAFCDKVVGNGPEALKGQLIKAHYVGKLENGKVFDSSYNRGKPLAFRVGVGEVIKGWDQGILGGDGIPPMLAGGKRVLKLPPELGYGGRGAGCRGGSCIIPPDSVLLFEVEFIGKA